MDCWYPITIPRPSRFQDPVSSIIFTKYYGRMQVPCGRCPACRRRRQNEWAYRILEEAKHTRLVSFLTLTYSDDMLPMSGLGIPTLVKHHLQTFFKNLRYDLGKSNFRYFACGEYGDQFGRPHYHACFFYSGLKSHDDLKLILQKRWIYGFIDYEPDITAGRAKYCAKYSLKQVGFDYEDCLPPFALMSRRPGIGKRFLDEIRPDIFRKLNMWHVHDYQGTPYYLPRYYRDRIYTENEREIHSIIVERLHNLHQDTQFRFYSEDNPDDSFYRSASYDAVRVDRKFVRMLNKENYMFKHKKKNVQRKKSNYGEEFVTDEF